MSQEHIVIRGEMASGKSTIAWGIQSWLRELNKDVQVITNLRDYGLACAGSDTIWIWDGCEPPKDVVINRIINVEKVR